MKTKEESNALKKNAEAVNEVNAELDDDELENVVGGTIGAARNRLDYTSSNLTVSSENVQSAESTYRDADMAKEMTTFTKNNILSQTAQSMLAQANQLPQGVLELLQ